MTGDALGKLLRDVFHAENVAGTFVISTCNRAEIYADVDKFHGGVAAICELLARHSGVPLAELTPHLYVHYEDRAVQHLLAVACGLDSMVVGESQILGQVRQALQAAREQGTLGRTLAELGALALRAGKRAHAETGIDRAGASLVSVGLTAAAQRRYARERPGRATGRGRSSGAAATARRRADHGPAASGQATPPVPSAFRWRARRPSGAGGWRRFDELAGRRDRGPDGRGRPCRRQPQPRRMPSGSPPRSARHRGRGPAPGCPPRSPRPTWWSPAPARPGS